MIDHLGIKVRNFEASKKFYLAALGPLGYSVVMEFGGIAAGLGIGRKPDFWISQGEPSGPIHLAFASDKRAPVDAFYKAAMAAGAKDNGPPGVREHYHPNYYGAFVFDLDGNNIEAVCHLPQGKAKATAKKAASKKAAPKKAAPKKAAPKKAAPKKAAPKKNSAKKTAKRRG